MVEQTNKPDQKTLQAQRTEETTKLTTLEQEIEWLKANVQSENHITV